MTSIVDTTSKAVASYIKRAITSSLHLIQHPRLARQEIDIMSDYYSFKRKYGFLRQNGHQTDEAGKVLIVSLTDWIAQAKMEGMLAKALQLRGYSPVIATYRSCRHALKYFKAFGYNSFVFFDDMLHASRSKASAIDTHQSLDGTPSFPSLLELQFRGVFVGRHTLSTIVRILRHGSIEFMDPQVMQLLRELLPRSMQSVFAAEALLDRVQPDIVLFLEKGYTPYGEVFDVAVNRDLNTIQWNHSHRSDALVLKHYSRENRDYHSFSLSPESWDSIRQMPWSERQESELRQELQGRYEGGTWFSRKYLQTGKKIKNASEVRRQLGLESTKKTAIIFSHVLWDATFFYGKNLFDDYEQWLVETVKAACTNRAVNWIIKVHPDYVWKMKQLGDSARPRDLIALSAQVGDLPEHIRVMEPQTDISTYSLFDITDYCITVRGTIGIEMACFDIPVFTAGTGRYSGLGFTIDSISRDDYREKLLHIQDYPKLGPERTLLAKKHAYALFRLRPLGFSTFEMVQMPLSKLGHPLDHNVVIRAQSVDDLVAAPDLKAFVDWATNPHLVDFLADDIWLRN